MNKLAVVTTHFNPCGYETPHRNYWRFRDGIEAAGLKLYTVEIAFWDEPFTIDDAIHLQGDDRHLLWQKERACNVGIQNVPEEFDAIAWIDADILFTNPQWPQDTLRALDEFPIVQLFEDSAHAMPDGSIEPYRKSCAWAYAHGLPTWRNFGQHHPGFAWAGRADWLKRFGLLDTNVTGGGDCIILKGIANERLHRDGKIGREWMRSIQDWAAPVREAIGGRFGYVPGTVHHLWHGTHQNRRYQERFEYLTGSRFDPATDLEIDQQGLYRWTEHAQTRKRRMVRQVADYFRLRREDDEPVSKTETVSVLNSEPQFTVDWFSQHVPTWKRILQPLVGRPVQCLEIGSYEGRSALWLMEHVCTHPRSRLTCIDPWEGTDGRQTERRFNANLQSHRRRLRKLRGKSHVWLRSQRHGTMDFVYIDGCHEGRNVLEDGVLAFRMLKPGGLLCFDDYEWQGQNEPKRHVLPKPAIDAFLSVYGPFADVLDVGYQLWLRKGVEHDGLGAGSGGAGRRSGRMVAAARSAYGGDLESGSESGQAQA